MKKTLVIIIGGFLLTWNLFALINITEHLHETNAKLFSIERYIFGISDEIEESTRRISDEALQYYVNIDQKVGYLKDIFEFTPDPCKLKTKEQPKGK